MKRCYYLIYRYKEDDCTCGIDLENPTGAMVLKPDVVFDEHAIVARPRMFAEAKKRYHCGPNEHVMLSEIYDNDPEGIAKVKRLVRDWKKDRIEFLHLMGAD